jgi:glycosyltransferase involved in cell wall biosynthesis
LTELLTNENLLKKMGAAARAVAEQYSWQRAAQSILAIYEKLAAEPGKRVWEGEIKTAS